MLSLYVSNRASRERVVHPSGPIEIGRAPRRELPRVQVNDPKVSGDQLRLEEAPDHQLLVENLSQKVAVTLADGTRIEPGGTRLLDLPARLSVGDTLIEVEHTPERPAAAASGALHTIDPPLSGGLDRTLSPHPLGDDPTTAELARWFESLIAVQRSAASSFDFLAEAARALVDLIGLDVGLVLLRRENGWIPIATHPPDPELADSYSETILETVLRERRTYFSALAALGPTSSSLDRVASVVASPILGEDSAVTGILYGARWARGGARRPLRPLDAQLTQVLASAVAAGLARHYSELEASRQRVQFEQFFTADLAEQLDRDPALLDGREREVTILFADIRGFSALSERIAPRQTCELIRDAMEQLTRRIREHQGVVVDYIGDGLLAMWNAPLDQPDHADRACRAALAMRGTLPELNRRWEGEIGHPIDVGVGLNTGMALVGNVGSRAKFKYGPLGHTVNLASRVEGATKQLGVNVLMTGSTRQRLTRPLATRRVCRVRVVGMSEEAELHELQAEQASSEWTLRRDAYEAALDLYEAGRWSEACHRLFLLLAGSGDGRYDGPSLTLLGRSVECLKSPPARFDPVIELRAK
jgi:adenylate cyclase